jgi:hypothetical protein
MVILRLSHPNDMVTKDYRKGVYKWVEESGQRVIGLSDDREELFTTGAQRHKDSQKRVFSVSLCLSGEPI